MNQMPLRIEETLFDRHIIAQAAFNKQEALHDCHVVEGSVETNTSVRFRRVNLGLRDAHFARNSLRSWGDNCFLTTNATESRSVLSFSRTSVEPL